MRFIKSFFIFILASLLFLSLLGFAFFYTFQQTIKNPDFYISIIKNLDISQLIYDTIEEEISEKIGQEFSNKIPENAKKLVKVKIKQLFNENIKDSTYAFHDYISGKSKNININIDTQEVKKELKPLALKILLASQSKEIQDKFGDKIEKEFNILWEKMMTQIPNNISGNLIKNELEKSDVLDNINEWRDLQSQITQFYYINIAAVIIIILLILLLHLDLKKSILLFGTIFLLSGGLLLLPLLFVNSHLILNFINDTVYPELINQNFPDYLIIIIKNIIQGLLHHFRVILIGYVVIGILSIIGSLFLKSKNSVNNAG